ncbi:hypothetical protein B296_00052201 [Ensete ventricosum]|uniref:Rubisco LSMT substrate-binding domain-containing protein n=1 Tax=Ensete ventricosum TaxID=4639 RepID=A0A426WZY7_ENSVE|nr:hypothetical protein B296_00052201 [Ensete ventricosum]
MALGFSNRKLWITEFSALSFSFGHLNIHDQPFFCFCLKISSRTLHIPWDSAGCLCPVGDLFNYAAPDEDDSPEMSDSKPETTSLSIQLLEHISQEGTVHNAAQPDGFLQRLTDGGYDENMNSYCFYARKRYKKGEQVQNPNDKAFIELKAEVCTSSSWPRDSLYIQHDGVPSFALLCALRLWATPMNLRRTVGNRIYSGSMVSVENEVLIMKWLAKHCTDILARLKTTIGEDGMLWSTIDKMIDHPSCLSSTVVLPRMSELREFFEAHGLTVEAGDYNGMPVKARRSLERWKYAIQWRLAYKKMLQGCVFYCENLICCLSPQHF